MLMKLLDIEIDIKINENGIYSLGFNGASGKSYLYELMESYANTNDNETVLAFTYDKRIDNNYISESIMKFCGKYIILDRLDLYFDVGIRNALISKSEECIILIDLKNDISLRRLPIQTASIYLFKDKLEVCSL